MLIRSISGVRGLVKTHLKPEDSENFQKRADCKFKKEDYKNAIDDFFASS